MRFRAFLQTVIRPLVENRLLLSLGISAASGIVLHGMFPLNTASPFMRLIELERLSIFHTVVWSYDLFLYSTPFLPPSLFIDICIKNVTIEMLLRSA